MPGTGFLFGGRLSVNSVRILAGAVGPERACATPGLSDRQPACLVAAACLQDRPGGRGSPSLGPSPLPPGLLRFQVQRSARPSLFPRLDCGSKVHRLTQYGENFADPLCVVWNE